MIKLFGANAIALCYSTKDPITKRALECGDRANKITQTDYEILNNLAWWHTYSEKHNVEELHNLNLASSRLIILGPAPIFSLLCFGSIIRVHEDKVEFF
jgi:hypothetical protein